MFGFTVVRENGSLVYCLEYGKSSMSAERVAAGIVQLLANDHLVRGVALLPAGIWVAAAERLCTLSKDLGNDFPLTVTKLDFFQCLLTWQHISDVQKQYAQDLFEGTYDTLLRVGQSLYFRKSMTVSNIIIKLCATDLLHMSANLLNEIMDDMCNHPSAEEIIQAMFAQEQLRATLVLLYNKQVLPDSLREAILQNIAGPILEKMEQCKLAMDGERKKGYFDAVRQLNLEKIREIGNSLYFSAEDKSSLEKLLRSHVQKVIGPIRPGVHYTKSASVNVRSVVAMVGKHMQKNPPLSSMEQLGQQMADALKNATISAEAILRRIKEQREEATAAMGQEAAEIASPPSPQIHNVSAMRVEGEGPTPKTSLRRRHCRRDSVVGVESFKEEMEEPTISDTDVRKIVQDGVIGSQDDAANLLPGPMITQVVSSSTNNGAVKELE